MPQKQFVCFNCGTPTGVSIQTKEHPRREYVCMDARCWKTYYRDLASTHLPPKR